MTLLELQPEAFRLVVLYQIQKPTSVPASLCSKAVTFPVFSLVMQIGIMKCMGSALVGRAVP
jgi:hypothetical protein